MNIFTKHIQSVVVIAIAVVLGGCTQRIIPDELVLVKYNTLEMPAELVLPEPNRDATHLGYKPARKKVTNVVKADIKPHTPTMHNTIGNDGVSLQLLSVLQLSSVDMNIATVLQEPMGERVVVIIDEEKQRLAKNLADNLPLNSGEVPKILAKKTRAGVDELFDE